MQTVLNNPQKGRCSFFFLHLLLQPIFTIFFQFPTCSQNHPHNPDQHTLPLYLSQFAHHYFYIKPSLAPSPKILSLISAMQQIYAALRPNKRRSFAKTNIVLLFLCFLMDGQGKKCLQSLIPYRSESEN